VKQLFQDMKTGETILGEVPTPQLQPGFVKVRTHYSVVSAGTERMVMELGKKSYLGKARARPDLAMKVLKKVKTEGLMATLRQTMARLESPIALGYSSAGEVLEVGEEVYHLQPGDRVACAGGGWAAHAEVAVVPKNLCVKVPSGLDLRDAAYATVGAIALQGIRVAEVRTGETVAVIGLGIIGQLAVQLLKASGCRVVGIEPGKARAEVASRWADAVAGSDEEAERAVGRVSRGRGADAVLITAATASSAPVRLAAELARDRAVVCMVGAAGMEIPRDPYYHKELQLRLSRSYGPGRYDREYEEKGRDYPEGYVRWTEGRNLEAFLDLAVGGSLELGPLTTHEFAFDDALQAYELLEGKEGEAGGGTAEGPTLGMVFRYPVERKVRERVVFEEPARLLGTKKDVLSIGFIGAGNFAKGTLLPILAARKDVVFTGIATATGLTAARIAEKYGFAYAAETAQAVIDDPAIDAVFIATRHDSHAPLAAAALRAGRHVFVEKPTAITMEQLEEVEEAVRTSGRYLMTGFNRRFSPLTEELVGKLRSRPGPIQISIFVNPGEIEKSHWTQDPEVGGGRLIGEGCHFIDLAAHLAGSPISGVQAATVPRAGGHHPSDSFALLLTFGNGAVASIHYVPDGDPSHPKEHIRVAGMGLVAEIDDWHSLSVWQGGQQETTSLRGQDKGHAAGVGQFLDYVSGANTGEPPIGLQDQLSVAEIALETSEYSSLKGDSPGGQ